MKYWIFFIGLTIFAFTLLPGSLVAQTSFDGRGGGTYPGGSIIAGFDSRTCDGTIEGAIRYNSSSVTLSPSDYTNHWEFDETSGTTITDSAGSSNGTWQGAAISSTAGIIGTALNFNGTNNYITVPDAASLETQDDMTISLWVKYDAAGLGNKQSLLYKYHSASPWLVWEVTTDTGNTAYFLVADTSAGYTSTGSSILYADQWYHIVATMSGGTDMKFYVNSTRNESWNESPVPNPLFQASNGILSFGAENSGAYPFDGAIDDIRIYDRELSNTEINQIYQEGLNGGPSGTGCAEFCNGASWVCP